MKYPVLIPNIFNFPFTYESDIDLKVGDYVYVPFGKSKITGVIWDTFEKTNKKNFKVKKILKKIEIKPLKKETITFLNWFSEYNLVPKGMCLKLHLLSGEAITNYEDENYLPYTKQKFVNKFTLSSDQREIFEEMSKKNNKFRVHLLQGTTGSGKTIVYFKHIKQLLEKGQQAMILLPEIGLTAEFENKFEEFFGFSAAVWHSGITPKKKKIIWSGVSSGKINVIIGARSSLFLPFKNLGIIVVDEEHDQSFKQDEGIIYNARDMAISRASFEKIPIHLISSVPSIETYRNIRSKKYRHIKINKRFENFPLPETKIINLNFKKIKDKFISAETVNLVKKYLEKGDQVLFFINRRGFAPYLICNKCGHKLTCTNCSMYLTFHKIKNKAICHHCSFEKNIKENCKLEGNCKYIMYGPGVEKIFEEVKELFPGKKINIFSSDYLKNKEKTKKLFSDIKENKIDILIGTQMISKGFNFPKLNCIVVIDADFSGRGYDLRTTEKNIQLYHQLSGRAGRFSSKSLIIYQTLNPNDVTLNELIKNRSEELLQNELVSREKNRLPPFIRLISIIISSNDRSLSLQGAREIKIKLNNISNLEVLGPVDSPLLKIKKKFRSRLLLRFNNQFLMQKKISKVLNGLKISSKIKLMVDVDPINFA